MSTTQQVKKWSERKTGLKDYFKHRLNLIIDEFSDWTRGGDWQVQEGGSYGKEQRTSRLRLLVTSRKDKSIYREVIRPLRAASWSKAEAPS